MSRLAKLRAKKSEENKIDFSALKVTCKECGEVSVCQTCNNCFDCHVGGCGKCVPNDATLNAERPKTAKAEKPLSRLERAKIKTKSREQKEEELKRFNRSMGQHGRHVEKHSEPEPVKTGVISAKNVHSSRLARLGLSKSRDQDTTARRVKVQLNTDDSHLNVGNAYDDTGTKSALIAKYKLEELENDNSPFKIVPYEILDQSQKDAVEGVVTHKYCIINGPAGTGKTTVTQHVVEREKEDVTWMRASSLRRNYEASKEIPAVAFVAFTGKATQNMREKLPPEFRDHNCMTMHRMLGYAPVYEEAFNEKGEVYQKMIFQPSYDVHNTLKWEIIYIDEAGMAPAKLVNQIIAFAPNAKIRFIGDSAQLPAVHGLAPFNAYLTSLPTYTLTKVHRTDDQDLVMHATRIRNGERVEFNRQNCFSKLISPNQAKAQGQAVSAIVNLHASGDFDPALDTIITPINEKEMGQKELNRMLRRHFNPDNPVVVINAITQTCRYAVGDKVMVLSNDDESGLTNGMTGWIVEIERNGLCTRNEAQDFKTPDTISLAAVVPEDEKEKGKRQASHITYVYFPTAYSEDKIVTFSTQGQYNALSHGYVSTCHKAQGSEYRNVIVVMHPQGKRLINREWFYTAWTRAKEKVYVLSDLNSLACARNKQVLKGTTVQDKAEKFIEKHRAKIEMNTQFFDDVLMGHEDERFSWDVPVLLEE